LIDSISVRSYRDVAPLPAAQVLRDKWRPLHPESEVVNGVVRSLLG